MTSQYGHLMKLLDVLTERPTEALRSDAMHDQKVNSGRGQVELGSIHPTNSYQTRPKLVLLARAEIYEGVDGCKKGGAVGRVSDEKRMARCAQAPAELLS